MGAYIVRRCIQTVVVLGGLTVLLFTLLKAESVGPCATLLTNPTPDAQALYNGCIASHGLDKPLPVQYAYWVGAVLRGDFGTDYNQQAVLDAIGARLPATLLLIGFSYLLQEVIAIPLGIVGALRRNSIVDRLLTLLAYTSVSLPTFWLAALLILVVAEQLGWLPPGGTVSIGTNDPVVLGIPDFGTPAYWRYVLAHPGPTIGDLARHLVLPAMTLALAGIAADSRVVRSSMLAVIDADYVRTARAKGLSRRVVVGKHMLRNALLPLITNVGLSIPALASGAMVVETVFNWPGVGRYFLTSVVTNDPNAILAILLFSGFLTLLGNLAADVCYGLADPRIRYD